MENLNIIKIGGEILNNPERLNLCLLQVSKIEGKKILVHGGGRLLDELGKKLDIEQTMVQGRRITTKETLDLATMVYAGAINKSIVALLSKLEIPAIGLCGADCGVIVANKRSPEPINFGYVGNIIAEQINTYFINLLLEQRITPVFCSITISKENELLNSNADSIASGLAAAMSNIYYTKLFYCFEKNGLLKNIDDEGSVIDKVSKKEYLAMLENKQITMGMIPKLETAFSALEMGTQEIYITKEDNICNIINGEKFGTRIY